MPKEYWKLKVARDNLLNELDLLRRLLDIYPTAMHGLATYYCIIACLCVPPDPFSPRNRYELLSECRSRPETNPLVSRAVVVGATSSSKETAVKAGWGITTAALTLVAGVTTLRTSLSISARRCMATVWGLHEKPQNDSLNEADKHSLETSSFRVLWWTSFMLTTKPPGGILKLVPNCLGNFTQTKLAGYTFRLVRWRQESPAVMKCIDDGSHSLGSTIP